MIYALAREIDRRLQLRKFPVRVLYGPERLERYAFDPVIIFERDREQGDIVRPPVAAKGNPRRRAIRDLGVSVTIYARSYLPGARVNEHEFDCEQIVDALVVALAEWFTEEKTGMPAPEYNELRYLHKDEWESLFEQWPGVAYVMRFRVPRSVNAVDYLGVGKLTGAPAGVSGDVEIRRNADDPPEVINLP